VVIGVDGMSTQGLMEAHTPCMDSLMQSGAYSFRVRSVLPSVSSPNWSAMLCGAGPEVTGVVDNSWQQGVYELPAVTFTDNGYFPGIFRVLRDGKPEAVTASFYNWGGFGNLLEKEVIDEYASCPSSLETAQKTAEFILDRKPDFVFIQLDEVDGYGHSSGHMSPAYLKGIEEVDTHVELIVNAVRDAGIAPSTLIMVVSDHGGIFYWHGGNAYEEVTTPIIFSGKGVKKDYLIHQQIYKYDVAADVAFAFGLEAPHVWTGRPTRTAYAGFGEGQKPLYKELETLPPPMFYADPVAIPHGGLFVDIPAQIVIKKPIGVDGEIRYTTDGTTPTRKSALYEAPFTTDTSVFVTAKLFGKTGESAKVNAQYRVADSKTGCGLNYAYYTFESASATEIKEMPAFAPLHPVATGICYEIDMATPDILALRTRYDRNMGICYSGWLQVDADAPYNFVIWTKGGSKLYIDSELVVNNRHIGDSGTQGEIYLTRGRHPIRLEYFRIQHIRPEVTEPVNLEYEAPGMSRRKVPADKLFLSGK